MDVDCVRRKVAQESLGDCTAVSAKEYWLALAVGCMMEDRLEEDVDCGKACMLKDEAAEVGRWCDTEQLRSDICAIKLLKEGREQPNNQECSCSLGKLLSARKNIPAHDVSCGTIG